jgi:hypothetical protein
MSRDRYDPIVWMAMIWLLMALMMALSGCGGASAGGSSAASAHERALAIAEEDMDAPPPPPWECIPVTIDGTGSIYDLDNGLAYRMPARFRIPPGKIAAFGYRGWIVNAGDIHTSDGVSLTVKADRPRQITIMAHAAQ